MQGRQPTEGISAVRRAVLLRVRVWTHLVCPSGSGAILRTGPGLFKIYCIFFNNNGAYSSCV